MEVEQLRQLAKDPLFEIGSHTATHPSLPQHPSAFQHRELESSRAQLELWTGRTVTTLAYPYGDFDHSSEIAAQTTGFKIALTAASDRPRRINGLAQFGRQAVKNWDGETFERWVTDLRL
jgi:peptidoglycan/xylan/chitin deacetylase (PgdA/CDA1 family)